MHEFLFLLRLNTVTGTAPRSGNPGAQNIATSQKYDNTKSDNEIWQNFSPENTQFSSAVLRQDGTGLKMRHSRGLQFSRFIAAEYSNTLPSKTTSIIPAIPMRSMAGCILLLVDAVSTPLAETAESSLEDA